MSVNQVSIGSDNGLSPIRRQAIIYTNAGLLSIRPLGTNFSEILIQIQNFSFMGMNLKILWNGGHFVQGDGRCVKLDIHTLTLNVRGPSYLGLTTSILWLLMPWLLGYGANADILSIGPLKVHFSKVWAQIQIFSLKKSHLKMSAKWKLLSSASICQDNKLMPKTNINNPLLLYFQCSTFSQKLVQNCTRQGMSIA